MVIVSISSVFEAKQSMCHRLTSTGQF